MAEATDTNRFGLDYLTTDQAQKVDALNQQLAKINANAAITPDVNLLVFPIETYWPGTVAAGKTIYRRVAISNFYFPASMAGSRVKAGVAATASAAYTLKKNGTTFCTVTFAATGTVATYSASSLTSFVPGDELTIVGPAGADATLADIGWNLLARYPVPTTEVPVFTSFANATQSIDAVTKTTASSAFDAAAKSVKSLQYGNGYIRGTLPVNDQVQRLGLTYLDPGTARTNFSFAIETSLSNSIQIYELNVTKYNVAGIVIAGDELEVAIDGAQVKYYRIRDGVRLLLYTSAVALTSASYPLMGAVAIYSPAASITGISMSGVLA